MADGIQIKERVELVKELEKISINIEDSNIYSAYKNLSKETISSLLMLIIKGILFEYYVSTNNYQAYNSINQ